MAIEFIITERLLEFSAEYLFEHGTSRGARWMLKLIKRRSLETLQNRVTIKLVEGLCCLDTTLPNRYVCFGISVTNPTPWKLKITDVCCSILYNDVTYSHKAIVRESLPIRIPKETISDKVFEIRYDPFSSPLGLPPEPVGWKINGYLCISSYIGNFEKTIPTTPVRAIVQNENEWLDAVNYVKSKIRGV